MNLNAIADALRTHGRDLHVTVEYPGCVVVWAEDLVDHPDHAWWFGTANETWAGDLTDGTGQYLGQTLTTDVPSSDPDPVRIALAILDALDGADDPCAECARSYGPSARCRCDDDGHDFDSASNLDGGRCRRCKATRTR